METIRATRGEKADQADHADRFDSAVRLLVTADLSTCGHRELDVLSGALQRVRGFVSSWDVRLARRREELMAVVTTHGVDGADAPSGADVAAATAGTEPPATAPDVPSTLDGAVLDLSGFEGARDRRPGRDTEQDRARARVCALLPMFEHALAAGRVDAAHVDAVAAAWADLDDDERVEFTALGDMLVGYATVETPERFRRRARDLARSIARDHGLRVAERQRARQQVRRWINMNTGMGHLSAELDPETTAIVWAALDAHVATVRSRDDTGEVPLTRLEVDAFVELVTTSAAIDPRVPEVSVHIDWTTLQTGVFAAGSVCETSDGLPLTPAAVRRLACEANIIPIVFGGDGVPLDVGRARRLATREQRRALAAMYATCAMPGCTVGFERCRIHHIDPWLPTGVTNLANLIPVCDRHHHQVHEGGWALTMTPDRTITVRSPDGTIRFHGDSRTRMPAGQLHAERINGDALDTFDALTTPDEPSTNHTGPDQRSCGHVDDDAALDRHLADIAIARVAALTRRRCRTGSEPRTDAPVTTQPHRGP